jgi:hypothetical protein
MSDNQAAAGNQTTVPAENVIERASFESRLRRLRAELEEASRK